MYQNKPSPADIFNMIEAEKEIEKDSFRYDFNFDKLSNYNETIVSINLRIPFRKLHLLYLIPYQILKSYWSVILRRTDSNIIEGLRYHIDTEREHLKEIEDFFPLKKINFDVEFPHLLKKRD